MGPDSGHLPRSGHRNVAGDRRRSLPVRRDLKRRISGFHGSRAMWIEGNRLQVIDSALERGRRDDVERLLADIFQSNAKQGEIPTACPTCRRDLVRNALPGVGLYVSARPDRHGAWMTSDVVETLRRFVAEHATLAARKRHQLRILNRLLVILGAVLFAGLLYSYPERIVTTLVDTGSRFYDWRATET